MKPSNIIPIGAFPSRTDYGITDGVDYFDPDVYLHSEFLEFHRNFKKAITDRPRTASTSVVGCISKKRVRPKTKNGRPLRQQPGRDQRAQDRCRSMRKGA